MIKADDTKGLNWFIERLKESDDYWDWEDVDKNRIVSVYDKKVVK
jgi:hypothetical protein